MKFFLIIILLVPSFLTAQVGNSLGKELLPKEIFKYYENLNFVNSFSTKSERSVLAKYLDTQDVRMQPNNQRLIFVMNLLNDIRHRQLEEWNTMLNKFNSSQANFPYINEVQFYDESENLISVRLKVYELSESDNLKIISMYDEGKNSIIIRDELKQLSQPTYFTDEIHDWVLLNDQWQKKSVRKVLIYY